MSVVAERRQDLSGVVRNLNTTTRAIANQKASLREAIGRFPTFMRSANTTFVNLRGALDDLDPLVDASKPVAPKLERLLEDLRPFARDARPTVNDLDNIVRRPGSGNDLVELDRTFPPLASIALDTKRRSVDPGNRNRSVGRVRGAFPEMTEALNEAVTGTDGRGGQLGPIPTFRPYTPDLFGWFDDFSTTGGYDALGGISRTQVYLNFLDRLPAGARASGGAVVPLRPFLDTLGLPQSTLDFLDGGSGFDDPGVVDEKEYERCPGASEERASDGSNVSSASERRALDCDEGDRATGAGHLMRRVVGLLVLAGAITFAVVLSAAGPQTGPIATYKIEFDNIFGLTEGGDLTVAGVKAGKTPNFELTDEERPKALVNAEVSKPGFTPFRADAHCDIRQQSLIGTYYVSCQPGKSPRKLPDGATIPVEQTTSTIPIDLVNNIMRRPYKERFRILLTELGTGLAGRPQDIQEVLQRAHPGLRETSKTLKILGDQNQTIKRFIRDSDTVVDELEENKNDVARFVKEAGETAEISATRQDDIRRGFQLLPGFLRELRPTMARLGQLSDAQVPLLIDLQQAAPELNRFLVESEPFARTTRPVLRSLGRTSETGLGRSRRATRRSASYGAWPSRFRSAAAARPSRASPGRCGSSSSRSTTASARSRTTGAPSHRSAVAPTRPPTRAARASPAWSRFLNYGYWQHPRHQRLRRQEPLPARARDRVAGVQ